MSARMPKAWRQACAARRRYSTKRTTKQWEGRNREDFSAAFHGAPILRAQSAEIALKALWRIGHNEERGGPPHHHNLTELHDCSDRDDPEAVGRRISRDTRPHRVHTPQYRSAKDCGQSSTNTKPPSKIGVTPTNSTVSGLSMCSTRC